MLSLGALGASVALYFRIDGHASVQAIWPSLLIIPALAIGVVLTSPRGARKFRRRRGGSLVTWFCGLIDGAKTVRELFANPRTHWLGIVGNIAYWAGDILCLWAALQAVDVRVSVAVLVVAYSGAYVLTRRALPAGGAGVVEVALTFALVWMGLPFAHSFIAVVIYRLFNFWLPMLPALLITPKIKNMRKKTASTTWTFRVAAPVTPQRTLPPESEITTMPVSIAATACIACHVGYPDSHRMTDCAGCHSADSPPRLNGTPMNIRVPGEESAHTVACSSRVWCHGTAFYFPHALDPECLRCHTASNPAPGAPQLAQQVHDMLEKAGIAASLDPDRGFDHGMYAPMAVIYPQADVPTLQLSLKRGLDPREHLAVGRTLSALREEGVLIVGSGLSYHNLRAFGPVAKRPSAAFDDWLQGALTEANPTQRTNALIAWETAPAARQAHPREEHLLPLMVALGAAESEAATRVYHEDNFFGGISVSSFMFGGH